MISPIVFLLLIFIIIGGVLVAFIVHEKPNENRQLWQKYIVYLLLIGVITSSLWMGRTYFLIIISLMGIIGGFELIKIGVKTKQPKFILSSAFIIFALFYCFFFEMGRLASIEELLSVYFYVLIFDAFSQIAGKIFGKRKITRISPNKTWEGLLGGLAITLLSMILLNRKTTNSLTFDGRQFVFVLLLCLAFFMGDLLASGYKRICGVKDYSNLLPSHGGILDRYDSFIAAGIVYHFINLIYE